MCHFNVQAIIAYTDTVLLDSNTQHCSTPMLLSPVAWCRFTVELNLVNRHESIPGLNECLERKIKTYCCGASCSRTEHTLTRFLGSVEFMSQLLIFAWQTLFVSFSVPILSLTPSCHWFVIRLWSPVLCHPLASLLMYTVTNFQLAHVLVSTHILVLSPPHLVIGLLPSVWTCPEDSQRYLVYLCPYIPLYLWKLLLIVNVDFWALVFIFPVCIPGWVAGIGSRIGLCFDTFIGLIIMIGFAIINVVLSLYSCILHCLTARFIHPVISVYCYGDVCFSYDFPILSLSLVLSAVDFD